MKWFKHYANANESRLLSIILEEMGNEGYGLYWRIMELLCSNYDGTSTDFEFRTSTIKRFLGLRTTVRLKMLSGITSQQDALCITLTDKTVIFSAPILSKLKDRDFKKARTKSAKSALEENREEENREEESIAGSRPYSKKINIPNQGKLNITPDEVIDLFNTYCCGGRVKVASSLSGPTAIKNLMIVSGFPEFQKKEGWTDFFKRIGASNYLKGRVNNFVVDLYWATDPDYAAKIIAGRYDNNTVEAAEVGSLAHLNLGAE